MDFGDESNVTSRNSYQLTFQKFLHIYFQRKHIFTLSNSPVYGIADMESCPAKTMNNLHDKFCRLSHCACYETKLACCRYQINDRKLSCSFYLYLAQITSHGLIGTHAFEHPRQQHLIHKERCSLFHVNRF